MKLSQKAERLGYVATVLQVIQDSEKDAQKVGKKENVCTLCEEFAAQALSYLNANKTQNEIKDILHESCSKLQSFEEEVFFANFKCQFFYFFPLKQRRSTCWITMSYFGVPLLEPPKSMNFLHEPLTIDSS